MENSNKLNENEVKIEENHEKNIESNDIDLLKQGIEEPDKIETKGLKLKRSTKERLNLVQGGFDDAESMIVALLNQYEVFNTENNDKFADRKAEIDRFNFLMESLKNCFVNSLEMASFIEEKYVDKIKGEIKKKDKVISLLQEENNSLKTKVKNVDLEINKKSEELKDVKDSFTRVNLALTTVEKELNEKSTVINNLQLHIASLTEISQDNKDIKAQNENLKEEIKSLESQLTKVNISNEKLNYLKNENNRYISEIENLQLERNEYKEYSNTLNAKIQEILVEKANEISRINNEKNNVIREIEENKNRELKEANDTINKLKEELFELKIILNKNNIVK